jgi:hypothetical protein
MQRRARRALKIETAHESFTAPAARRARKKFD